MQSIQTSETSEGVLPDEGLEGPGSLSEPGAEGASAAGLLSSPAATNAKGNHTPEDLPESPPLQRKHTENTQEFLLSLAHEKSDRKWMSYGCSRHLSTLPDAITKSFPEHGIFVGQLDKQNGLHGFGAFRYENGDVYEGAWENNQRHGEGLCVFRDKTRYEGEWCNDQIEGEGILRYSDGSHYQGTFYDNMKHGVGEQHYASGSVYNGEWDMGRKTGTGTMKSFDGNTYSGGWKQDKRCGYGTYMRENREWQYTGYWEAGKRHGNGIIEYANGDMYEGEFRADKLHGDGTMSYADGSQYSGEWENNHKHGEGTLVSANKEKYVGYWMQGMRQGFGTQVYLNVDRYEGQWSQDEFNGQGTFTYFEHQQRYQGEFRDGYRHGKGKMIFSTSDWYEGDWNFDVMEGQGVRSYPDGSKYAGGWKGGQREGDGVSEMSIRTDQKQGQAVWKYEGKFSENMKHGDGLESFQSSKVWVTYQRNRLVQCSLKEAETGLKQRKAWAKEGYSDSIPRGEVALDVAAWHRLELAFVDSVSHLHRLAVGTPMLRALLKNPALLTPGRGLSAPRPTAVHLDDAVATPPLSGPSSSRRPSLEAPAAASPALPGLARRDSRSPPQLPVGMAPAAERFGSPALGGSQGLEGASLALGSLSPTRALAAANLHASPRGPLGSTPRISSPPVGSPRVGSPRLGDGALLADSLSPGGGGSPGPLGFAGGGARMDNAALKLQQLLPPGHLTAMSEVGLTPLQRKPAGTIARRRQERAQEKRLSLQSSDIEAWMQALDPSERIAADWGPPGPKIDLGKCEPPL